MLYGGCFKFGRGFLRLQKRKNEHFFEKCSLARTLRASPCPYFNHKGIFSIFQPYLLLTFFPLFHLQGL